jgi:hypothetical protein
MQDSSSRLFLSAEIGSDETSADTPLHQVPGDASTVASSAADHLVFLVTGVVVACVGARIACI